jgi:hypothetical protein
MTVLYKELLLLGSIYALFGAHPFFPVLHSRTDSTPFLSSLSLIEPLTSRGLSSKAYRLLCLPPPSSSHHPSLIPSDWSRFWQLSLVLASFIT